MRNGIRVSNNSGERSHPRTFVNFTTLGMEHVAGARLIIRNFAGKNGTTSKVRRGLKARPV